MAFRLPTLLVAAMMALMPAMPTQAQPAPSGRDAPVHYHDFPIPGGLRIGEPSGRRTYQGKTYEYSQWISPVLRQGFDATELIASWNAATPEKTWIEVAAQVWTASGTWTAWYVLGQWASGDTDIRRTSVSGQDDAYASVNVDTLQTKPGVTLRAYRLRVNLYREAGSDRSPVVTRIGAMTSNIPDRFEVPVSKPGQASGLELPVPSYSQEVHKGHFSEYGGGGENWCSPTSTEMVVEYWGHRPHESDLSWIPADHPDRTVDYAARRTYDYAYEGTGNWPFNAAYAATFGLRGHITRLRSLNELEDYIARGIPVITSQSFLADELDGAGYGTAGHLMVVVGFTEEGDVIANDPASDTKDGVRRVYRRDQFEKIWLRTKRYTKSGAVAGGSGGIVYLITP